MRVYKPEWDRSGKTQKCEHWYIDFVDKRTNQHIRRRLPAYPSKAASERAALMIGELLSGNFAPEVQRWLEEIPESMRAKLTKWGLVDSRKWSPDLGKNLQQHLADYVAGMRADNCKEQHVKQTESEINHILTGCNFRTPTDLDGHKVKVFLAAGRGPEGYGQRTYNAYIVAMKGFCNWLWRQGRATGRNPMVDCDRMKQTECLKARRALTDDEAGKLLTAARNGPRHHRLTGRQRYLIYRLSLTTGARMGEIRILRVSSFNFASEPAMMHLEPGDTKGKRAADMILLPDVAAEVREYLQGKAPTEKVFPSMPPTRHTAEMIRADLAAAEVPYTNDNGQDADGHSLRHTFISNLARAGVHPAVMQKIARHADIKTTMKYYTHILRESEIDAMQRLSRLPSACLSHAPGRTFMDSHGLKTSDIDTKTAISA